ncbi:MAG: hypothetical protein K9M75_02255, partial [Phycisphaerae bacterium]|nr:hypothetical protein [Phycisphaerae bacterium]
MRDGRIHFIEYYYIPLIGENSIRILKKIKKTFSFNYIFKSYRELQIRFPAFPRSPTANVARLSTLCNQAQKPDFQALNNDFVYFERFLQQWSSIQIRFSQRHL